MELSWLKTPNPKGYILYEFIYITLLKLQNCKHGDHISGCQELKEVGRGAGGYCYDYNTATRGICVVVGMFCILTVSILVSGCNTVL